MPRSASPALSENEVDISRALLADAECASDSEDGESTGRNLSIGLTHGRDGHDRTGRQNGRQKEDDAQDDGEYENEDKDGDGDEDEAFIAATQVAAHKRSENKSAKKASAFQSMGLNANLLRAIMRKGFSAPTPIQRKTIPLILDGQDVVGMARTGSGKTAAFVIPMMEKLKSHSAKVGARAVVLSPSRELALQTLKVVKEMGRGTGLRTALLVGGDSLEDQFGSMANNPDIIIATPGRFQHLKVEMRLDLSSVKYIVFDEADRLFEMGFAVQLTEIMHSLPPSRQTMLFSATLPRSLVEFARAGLQDPKLVRLDAESKIAPGLQSAFFLVKRADKESALLHLLQDVIQMPVGATEAVTSVPGGTTASGNKKRKRDAGACGANETPSRHSTVVFAATKHHVDYLASFLKAYGYATSYVYGTLDQTARKVQVHNFRTGITNILVVTDVAARGLDIPILANVINYDFPAQPKIFVHRVGRTARAGREGWSYSLVTHQDLPYLIDLQLFLARQLTVGRTDKDPSMFKEQIVLGTMVQDKLERLSEESSKLLADDADLAAMQDVAAKGEKQYLRTRNAASAESVKRAKRLAQGDELDGTNMLFDGDHLRTNEQSRLDMLARISGFRPQETVFEIGQKGVQSEAAEIIKRRRAKLDVQKLAVNARGSDEKPDAQAMDFVRDGASNLPNGMMDHLPNGTSKPLHENIIGNEDADEELILTRPAGSDMDEASDSELQSIFRPIATARSKAKKWTGKEEEFFMSYTPSTINLAEDRSYGVHSGGTNASSHFLQAARGATLDLTNDESKGFTAAHQAKGVRWDKKSKKYVSRSNDEDGSRGQKMMRSESGQKIAASFQSGRFDAWRKAHRVERLPRVGELERTSHVPPGIGSEAKRFKHKQEKAPKEADKYRDDYYQRQKKVDRAREKRIGRFADGKGTNELRGVDDVRKARKLLERRREKNGRSARPSGGRKR